MATIPSKESIPSELPRDLKFNAGKIDEVVNSQQDAFSDRFGVSRLTWKGIENISRYSLINYGYILIDSFEDGATISAPNQALRFEATGEYFRWGGALPKIVSAGSAPDTSGGISLNSWVGIGDASLRSSLSSSSDGSGDELISVKQPFSGSFPTTQHQKNAERIHAKNDFKMVGDGVSDDSSKFQNALNAASGKVLVIPPGNYRIMSFINIPENTHIIAEQGAIIYLDPAMTTNPSVNFGGINRAMYGVNVKNITLENLTIKSSKTGVNKSITLAFLSVDGLIIKNCQFRDMGAPSYYAQGLIAFQSTNIHVSDSVFDNCSGDGMALSNNCLYYKITNNIFSNNGDWGLALVENSSYGVVQANLFLNNVSTATGTDRSSFVQFIGNNMYNNEHGVRICEFAVSSDKCESITITGNNISLSNYGISIENMKQPFGNFSVTGNTVNGSNQQGIQVINSQMGTISGNSIYSSSNAAILLQNSDAAKVTGLVSVTGNSIMSCQYGIQEIISAGTGAFNAVSGNNIQGATTSKYALTPNSPYIDASTTTYTTISIPLNFPSGVSQASASAGGTTPPTQVQGYIPVYLGGVMKKIPYYN